MLAETRRADRAELARWWQGRPRERPPFLPVLGWLGRLAAGAAALAVAVTFVLVLAPRAARVAAAVPRALAPLVAVAPRPEPLVQPTPTPTPTPRPSPVPLAADDEKVLLWLAFIDAVNRADLDALVALLTDDTLLQSDDCQPCRGIAAVQEYWGRMLTIHGVNLRLRVETAEGSGDYLTAMGEASTQAERDRGASWRVFQRSMTVRGGQIASVCQGTIPCEEKYANPSPFPPPPWTVPSQLPAPVLPADPLPTVTVPREPATSPSFIADGRIAAGMAAALLLAVGLLLSALVVEGARRLRHDRPRGR